MRVTKLDQIREELIEERRQIGLKISQTKYADEIAELRKEIVRLTEKYINSFGQSFTKPPFKFRIERGEGEEDLILQHHHSRRTIYVPVSRFDIELLTIEEDQSYPPHWREELKKFTSSK